MIKFIIISLIISLTFANECIKCHLKEYNKCKKSNHFTHKNEINLIFEAFGIKTDLTYQNIPKVKNINSTKDLINDLLNKKCLKCHIENKIYSNSNNLCLSCHNSHKNKFDKTLSKPKMKKCLKCHNNDFIGTDFLGLFPHDLDTSYKSPITKNGTYPKRDFGIEYHHLKSDLHYQKGFDCISCHNQKISPNWEKISCSNCHKKISKTNHPTYHKKISCIACHSFWQVNSYKLNLIKFDKVDFKKLKRLTTQEDIEVENILKNKLPNNGLWIKNYLFRRWENFYLINYKNKIELVRPLYQYQLTYINKNNNVKFEIFSKKSFTVAKPHTVIKEAKSCQMCHNNKLNLNDTSLINYDKLKGNLLKGSHLTKTQIKKLDSNKFKLIRAKSLFK